MNFRIHAFGLAHISSWWHQAAGMATTHVWVSRIESRVYLQFQLPDKAHPGTSLSSWASVTSMGNLQGGPGFRLSGFLLTQHLPSWTFGECIRAWKISQSLSLSLSLSFQGKIKAGDVAEWQKLLKIKRYTVFVIFLKRLQVTIN